LVTFCGAENLLHVTMWSLLSNSTGDEVVEYNGFDNCGFSLHFYLSKGLFSSSKFTLVLFCSSVSGMLTGALW
jgi:hypothetical protein